MRVGKCQAQHIIVLRREYYDSIKAEVVVQHFIAYTGTAALAWFPGSPPPTASLVPRLPPPTASLVTRLPPSHR